MQAEEQKKETEIATPQPDAGSTTDKENAEDPLLGTLLGGRYELLTRIGNGGMGTIYKARHTATEAIVALKLIHRTLISDIKSVTRFQQEAKILAALQHPNIIGVKAIDVDNGLCFLVMEYAQGISLSQLIKKDGKLPANHFQALFKQAATALAYAHSKGVIHRDLKPSNLMIVSVPGGADIVKVLDFGVSKLIGADDQMTTESGIYIGSPHYMSPEQYKGGKIDKRSDIYSLGCVMYEALMGKPPFPGKNSIDVANKHINEPIPADFPREFKPFMRIIGKCTTKDPAERYQSMEELLSALEEGENKSLKYTALPAAKPKPKPKTIALLVLAACAVVALGGLTYMFQQQSERSKTEAETDVPSHSGGLQSLVQSIRMMPPAVAVTVMGDKLLQGIVPTPDEVERTKRVAREPFAGRHLRRAALTALAIWYDEHGDTRHRDASMLESIKVMHDSDEPAALQAEAWARYLKRDGHNAEAKAVLQGELKYANANGWEGDAQDLRAVLDNYGTLEFEKPLVH